MKRVQDKVALVTGGGSGLGEASAMMLAAEGARVVLADIDEAAAKRVLRRIKAAGGQGAALQMDVSQEADWIRVMASIQRRYKGLHITLNSAGINRGYSDPRETEFKDWKAVMSVNLDGVFLGTKHSMRLMAQSTPVNGSIINISSIMGLIGHPGIGAYNASKGGVRLYPELAQKTYDALQPVGHLGQPEDIAYGVLYLASDESRFMTGAELVIDGGYTAR